MVEVEGMTATYTCQEGYRMVGSREVECTEAGWARQIPHCKGIIMEKPNHYWNLLTLLALILLNPATQLPNASNLG